MVLKIIQKKSTPITLSSKKKWKNRNTQKEGDAWHVRRTFQQNHNPVRICYSRRSEEEMIFGSWTNFLFRNVTGRYDDYKCSTFFLVPEETK